MNNLMNFRALFLIFYVILFFHNNIKVVKASRYQVVGHQNEDQYIRLKSQFDIEPATVLALPIDVPSELLSFDGLQVPRLEKVDATSADFVYGAGDFIIVDLVYTDVVHVTGNPFITVNTGCVGDEASCVTKEVQTFTCFADYGKFALRFRDSYIMNIDVNTTQDAFKYLLEELPGINEVTIHYSEEDDRDYSGGRRICSSKGNTVTITFEDVTLPDLAGNVPSLTLDRFNVFQDPRTNKPIGDSIPLRGSTGEYTPSITSPTTVITEGKRSTVGRADYYSGNGTNTVKFKYIVRPGDLAADLEVTGLFFSEGYIFDPYGYGNVSTSIAIEGSSGRTLSYKPKSLSFHRNIGVSTEAPTIISVTSPDADGIYTRGDTITIHVVFDLPVKIFNGEAFSIALSAGNLPRFANYHSQLTPYILVFKYSVEGGDSTNILDYNSETSLINPSGNGLLYRDTKSNDTLAILTLPKPKSAGSLSINKVININTANPKILSIGYAPITGVQNTSVATAGDSVILTATYDFPVVVAGYPIIWLANSVNRIDARVRTAPASQVYSYRRAKPNTIATITINLVINFRVSVGDTITITLPNFSLEGADSSVTISTSTATSIQFSAVWNPGTESVILTCIQDIPVGSSVSATIVGNSGLKVPERGMISGVSVPTVSIQGIAASMPSQAFLTPFISGLSALSLTLDTTALPGTATTTTLAFTVPESLESGDSLSIFFVGWTSSSAIYTGTLGPSNEWTVAWNGTENQMTLTLNQDTAITSYSLVLSTGVTLYSPISGVGASDLKFSMTTANNGDMTLQDFPGLSTICAVTSSNVKYSTEVAGATSGLVLTWRAGPTPIAIGDSVVFTLPAASTLSTNSDITSAATIDCGVFTTAVTGSSSDSLTFTATGTIAASTECTATITTGAGYQVPSTGIAITDTYSVQFISTNCAMPAAISRTFDTPILQLISPTITLSDTIVPADNSGISQLNLTFSTSRVLVMNDTIAISLQDFYRKIDTDVSNNNLTLTQETSGTTYLIDVAKSLYNHAYDTLTVFLGEDSQATAGTSTYTLQLFGPHGVVVPLNGLKPNSLSVVVTSDNGNAANQTVSNLCLGWCSGTASYSIITKLANTTITYTLSFSHAISTGQTINVVLPGFNRSIASLGVVVSSGGISSSGSSIVYTDATQQLDFDIPISISALTAFTVEIAGLRFSDDSGGTIQYNDAMISTSGSAARPSGALTYNFAYPTTYEDYICKSGTSGLEFSESLSQLNVSCKPSVALATGARMVITLPLFDVSGSLSFLAQGVTLDAANTAVTDVSNREISVYFSSILDPVEYINITISGISAPNTYSTAPSYQFMDANGQAGSRLNFETDEGREIVVSSSLSMTAYSIVNLTRIELVVNSTINLVVGDKIKIILPILTTANSATFNLLAEKNGGSLSDFSAATWSESDKTVTLTLNFDQADGAVSVIVYPQNGVEQLNLPDAGIMNGVTGTVIVEGITSGASASKEILVPCFGICSAAMTVGTPISGHTSDYVFTFTFGNSVSFTQAATDNITVALPNFNGTYVNIINSVTAENIIVSWIEDTSELAFKISDNSVYSSSAPLTVSIPRNYIIKTPDEGLRYGSTLTAVMHSSSTGVLRGISTTSDSIGKVRAANFTVSPRTPNVAVDIEFKIILEDQLSVGSIVYVTLVGHQVPQRSLYFTSEGILDMTDYMTLSGIASVTTTTTNALGNTITVVSPPQLKMTITKEVPAGSMIFVKIPKSSNVKLPINGVGTQQMPYLSISSTTSPISIYEIEDFSFVGSMYPSDLEITADNTTRNGIQNITATFDIFCSVENGAKIEIVMPGITGTDGPVTTEIISSQNLTSMTGSWTQSSRTLQLNVSSTGTFVEGTYKISIYSTNLKFDDILVYENDPRTTYAVLSSICPVDASSFDTSSARGMASTAITFDNPVANAVSGIDFAFTTSSKMLKNDNISLTLPNFNVTDYLTHKNAENVTANLTGTNQNMFGDQAIIGVTPVGLVINLTLSTDVDAGQSLNVGIPSSFGAKIPSVGVLAASHSTTILTQRGVFGSSAVSEEIGAVQSIQYVGTVSSATVTLRNPVISSATAMEMNFTLNNEVSFGETVTFYLDSFTRTGGDGTLVITGTAASYFSVVWSTSASTVTFTAIDDVPSGQSIGAFFDISHGFICPSGGISSVTTSYTIQTNAASGPIQATKIDSIDVVPSLTSSSIGLYSVDGSDDYMSSGDLKSVQLYPNHEISSDDIGSRVKIGSNFYTITAVNDSFLSFAEDYVESIVVGGLTSGSEWMNISTTSIRPARFLSGSHTNKLKFKYDIKRKDSIPGSELAPATPSGSNFISSSFDLNGGSIKRLAVQILIDSSMMMPTFTVSSLTVDTAVPQVVNVTTTTRDGVYSEGDEVDFQVRFDKKVVVMKSNASSPGLLLRMDTGYDNATAVTAYYKSGSLSEVLVFTYKVRAVDDLVNLARSVFRPSIQPLRILTNNHFNYIRRRAIVPYLDVNPTLTTALVNSFTRNVSFVGNATKVLKMYSNSTVRLDTKFTAGDVLQVFIDFNVPVRVDVGSEKPYILLDVNADTGATGKAEYNKVLNNNKTLEFIYQVGADDKLTNGLYITCGCSDYFNRTFIQLGTSQIYGSHNDQEPSLILAHNKTDIARSINSSVVIDNTLPSVTLVNSNITAGTYAPGSVALVSVHFTSRVLVKGYIRLMLRGQLSECIARYAGGNQTKTLSFLYVVTSEGATSKLDCQSSAALDTTLGSIYKDSENPELSVDTLLMAPGSYTSFGMQADVTIDTSKPKVLSVSVADGDSSRPLLSMPSITLLRRNGSSVELYNRYYPENDKVIISEDSTIVSVDSNLELNLDHSLSLQILYDDEKYTSYYISDQMRRPLSFGPQLVRFDKENKRLRSANEQWWSYYSIASTLEMKAVFNRDVETNSDAVLVLNTGTVLNRAFATKASATWFIDINVEGLVDAELQATFQLSLGGYVTRCIAGVASASGPDSVQEAIDAIPSFAVLGPTVTVIKSTFKLRQYRITLQRPSDDAIELVAKAGCTNTMPSSRMKIHTGQDMNFRYGIRRNSGVVLKATQTVPAGTYTFTVSQKSGITLNRFGVAQGTMLLEHFSADQDEISHQIITNVVPFPAITWSSLGFSKTMPGIATDIRVVVCLENFLAIGDELLVYLSSFTNSSSDFNYTSTANQLNVTWSQSNQMLAFISNSNSTLCFSETISDSRGIFLPTTAIYKNSKDFQYSVTTASQGKLHNATFSDVSAVGFSSVGMDLSDPRPLMKTSVKLTFNLQYQLMEKVDSITLYLPEFQCDKASGKRVVVMGEFAHGFYTTWDQNTQKLQFQTQMDINSGSYELDIPISEGITVGARGFSDTKPTIGISRQNTTIGVLSDSILSNYQDIISITSSELQVVLNRPVDTLSSLQFNATLSVILNIQFTVLLKMPFLTHSVGYQKFIPHGLNGSVTWKESLKAFEVSSNGLSGSKIGFYLSDLSEFSVVGGIPASNHGVAMSYASDSGVLAYYPVQSVSTVPKVTASRIRFTPDIFSTEYSANVTINVTFNTPARNGDELVFILHGVDGFEVSDSDVHVIGECAGVIGRRFFPANYTLIVPITENEEGCKGGVSSVNWFVTNATRISSPKIISQYGSNNFQIEWRNSILNTGRSELHDPPSVAFMTSSVDFDSPKAGAESSMTLKFITSSPLQPLDEIAIFAPNFTFPFTSTSILDVGSKAWTVSFDSSSEMLIFKNSINLPPTVIEFVLNGSSYAPTLPAWGVDTSMQTSFTIKLIRYASVVAVGQELNSQLMTSIRAVGRVSNANVTILPHPRLAGNTSDKTIVAGGIEFMVSLWLSQPLYAGDDLSINLPHLIFKADETLVLEDSSSSGLSGVSMASNKTLYFKLSQTIASRLDFTMKATNKIATPLTGSCSASACQAYITTVSKSLSLSNFPVNTACGFSASTAILTLDVASLYDFTSTNKTASYAMDIQLNTYNAIPAGSTLEFYVPYVIGNDVLEGGIRMLQNYTGLYTTDAWSVIYTSATQTISMTTSIEIAAGNQKFTLGTNDLSASSSLIYENDPNPTYRLVSPECTTRPSSFDKVTPNLLMSSSLVLSNQNTNTTSDLTLTVQTYEGLGVADIVRLKLPGFNTSVSQDVPYLTLTSNYPVVGYWRNYNSSVYLKIGAVIPAEAKLVITIPGKNNGTNILTPVRGSYAGTGLPQLRVTSGISGSKVTKQAEVLTYEAFVQVVSATLTFTSPRAGLPSEFAFAFELSGEMAIDDVIRFYLPNVFTTEPDYTLSVTSGVSVKWEACQETLIVTVTDAYDFASGAFTFQVTGLRLPTDGIRDSDTEYFSLSGTTTSGKIPNSQMTDVQYVGRIIASSLSIDTPSWDYLRDTMSLNLGFKIAGALSVGDEVNVRVPGLNISSYMLDVSGTLDSTGLVTATYLNTTSIITLTLVANAPPETTFQLKLSVPANNNKGMKIPVDGFPGSNLIEIKSNAISGPVDWTNVVDIEPVGIFEASVDYKVEDYNDNIEVRLTFHASGDFSIGDNVTFVTPSVTRSTGNGNVTVKGDSADDSFESPFKVFWNEILETFTITATKSITKRQFNVFVPPSSGFKLKPHIGTFNQTHKVGGWIASVGIPDGQQIAERAIIHTPSQIKPMNMSNVEVSKCSAGSACDVTWTLQLNQDISTGDIICLSHPNLRLTSTASSSSNISLSGSGGSFFNGEWRSADHSSSVSVSSDNIELVSNGYIRAQADMAFYDADLAIADKNIDVRIESDLPRVLSVFAAMPLQPVSPGDDIFLNIRFTEAVEVSNRMLKLSLSNGEDAIFYSGNGTDTIVMRYYVTSPSTTEDLAVLGPEALELSTAAVVSRLGDPTVHANITVPRPYNKLVRKDGRFAALPMNASGTASIQSVKVSSGSGTYSGGDILDIEVKFDRDVVVSGVPVLALDNPGESPMMAKFINVSREQVLDITNVGQFSVSYGGVSTACIDYNDSVKLLNEIRSLSTLKSFMPVTMLTSLTRNGRRYQLSFHGAAPSILKIVTVFCPAIGIGTTIFPESRYSTVVFRYEIQAGDSTNGTALAVTNSSALSLLDATIKVRASIPLAKVSVQLPYLQVDATDSQEVLVDTSRPYVMNVTASYHAPFGTPTDLGYAQTGDYIDIDVRFSYPLAIIGHPYLVIRVDKYDLQGVNPLAYHYLRNATFLKLTSDVVTFRYEVAPSDEAIKLDVYQADSLKLNGSNIFSDTDSLVVKAIPDINMTFNGTTGRNESTMSSNQLTISAVSNPRIKQIYTDHVAGKYGTGEDILITLNYYAPVTVTNTGEAKVALQSPVNGVMHYISGSGTNEIVYKYTVRPGDGYNTPLSFKDHTNQFSVLVVDSTLEDELKNKWTSTTDTPDTTQIDTVFIDVAPARVLSVETTSPDGFYYPGMYIDIIVTFDKKVIVLGGEPKMSIFHPDLNIYSRLAVYRSGSRSKQLTFRYVVPPMDAGSLDTPRTIFDYESVTSLSEHMGSAKIYEDTTLPSTEAFLLLPSASDSGFKTKSQLRLILQIPTVNRVYSTNPDGIYSAGDTVRIAVEYTQPVMVFTPPVLRMEAGDEDRDAIYAAGNNTNTLLFDYLIHEGDSNLDLDYVDTREPPYRMKHFVQSMALYTELRRTDTGRGSGTMEVGNLGLERRNDIDLSPDALGGVFRSSSASLIAARSQLPLPGDSGSLSSNSAIEVDTKPVTITEVFTTLPNGAYGASTLVPIYVRFSAAVVVSGCPYIVFYLSGVDRYASYAGGSGTTDLLFELLVSTADETTQLDYRSVGALFVTGCSEVDNQAQFLNPSAFYIKRKSKIPQQLVDLTLPDVTYLKTVVSPRSLFHNGHDLTLSGPEVAPRVVWSDVEPRNMGVGDIIDVQVTFGGDVTVSGSPFFVLSDLDRTLPLERNFNSSTLSFRLVVQPSDELDVLTYANEFALRGDSSCDIKDVIQNFCAGQTVPKPFQSQDNATDLLSPQRIKLTGAQGMLTNVRFLYTDVVVKDAKMAGKIDSGGGTICDESGNSYAYYESIDSVGDRRVVASHACANHFSTCQKAGCIGTAANSVLSQRIYEIPLKPEYAATKTDVSCRGEVGVALNGVAIYSRYYDEGNGCTDFFASEFTSLDKCGGTSTSLGSYKYHILPTCLLDQFDYKNDSHSPQVGWALDGFPIYGNIGPGGQEMRPCGTEGFNTSICLDECNGYEAAIPDLDGFKYRYYMPGIKGDGECASKITDPNFNEYTCARGQFNDPCCINIYRPQAVHSIGCFKGCLLNDPNCALSGIKGLVDDNKTPGEAAATQAVYDGSIASTSSYYLSGQSMPSTYQVGHWDIVTTNTVGVFRKGDKISFLISFTEGIAVIGRPALLLYKNGAQRVLRFTSLYDLKTARFELTVSSKETEGDLVCDENSRIVTSSTNKIYRRASFISLAEVDLSLAKACCPDGACVPKATVVTTVPTVTRVYSTAEGFFSHKDVLFINVKFSAPVVVVGEPILLLAFQELKEAIFYYQDDPTTLQFMYVVGPTDGTSSLDYYSTDALKAASSSVVAGNFDGIYADGVYSQIAANLSLPIPGTSGSLGVETAIVIDQARPVISGSSSSPAVATSGDNLLIFFDYSDPMIFVQSNSDTPIDSTIPLSQVMSVSLTVVLADGSTFLLNAPLSSNIGNRLTFLVPIDATVPSGSVFYASLSPLVINNGIRLISSVSSIAGQLSISQSRLALKLSDIDNDRPVVVQTYSTTNVEEFPVGAGDLIDVYVDMSLSVSVISIPTLNVRMTDGTTRLMHFVSNDTADIEHPPVTVPPPANQAFSRLHFQYLVVEGDAAYPLEYSDVFSLVGDIRRSSNKAPDVIAILDLKKPFTPGSLAYCCNVRIDTTRPYVESIIPLKREGTYGRMEKIVMLVRFSKPVVVTGTPLLELKVRDKVLTTEDVSNGMTTAVAYSNATYLANYTAHDLPIPIQVTDIFFEYTIQKLDWTKSLQHSKTTSFTLSDGAATILQRTKYPTTKANLLLQDPDEPAKTNGQMIKQWKFRYPTRVEVLMRDFFHSEPEHVTVSLEHEGAFATVFQECCSKKVFGKIYSGSRKGNNITTYEKDTAIGDHFLFSDQQATNLALRGVATQSSTLSGEAYKAIDDNISPLSGHLSCSETTVSVDAWWQVQLPPNSQVSTIAIWPRKPEDWITPVVKFSVRSLNGYPNGQFRLKLSNIDIYDPFKVVYTKYLPFGCSGVELGLALKEIDGMGDTSIDFKVMEPCGETGCGVGLDRGFGYVYVIDFLDIKTDDPQLVLPQADIKFSGGPVVNAGPEKFNTREFDVISSTSTLRKGQALEVPEFPIFPGETNGRGGYQTIDLSKISGRGMNAWLVPFYLMVFDDTQVPPPNNLTEARDTAVFFKYIDKFDTEVLTISLPQRVNASYVKLMRVGEGSLSMAEVQVYAEAAESLSQYRRGSPIDPSPLSRPYHTETPLGYTFNDINWDGRWVLKISQSVKESTKREGGYSGAYGTVSDWVLIITDQVGVVHSYYQDLSVEVLSLPKYGELYATQPSAPSPYGDWRESFQVGVGQQYVARPRGERALGICLGVDTTGYNGIRSPIDHYRYCEDNFGVGPNLNSRILGDTALRAPIQKELMIVYRPNFGYLGPDFFTFKVMNGLALQSHISAGGVQGSENEVTMHVRNCRRFRSQLDFGTTPTKHPLCACNQTETAIIDASGTPACNPVRETLCSNQSSETHYTFLNMCLACEGDRANSYTCMAETIRAVMLVVDRGFCSGRPTMDCSQEILTQPGREAVNALSIDAYFPPAGFTRTGKSIGGFSFYNSAPLT